MRNQALWLTEFEPELTLYSEPSTFAQTLEKAGTSLSLIILENDLKFDIKGGRCLQENKQPNRLARLHKKLDWSHKNKTLRQLDNDEAKEKHTKTYFTLFSHKT